VKLLRIRAVAANDDARARHGVLVRIATTSARQHAGRRHWHRAATHSHRCCRATYFGCVQHAGAQATRPATGLWLETAGGTGIAGKSGARETAEAAPATRRCGAEASGGAATGQHGLGDGPGFSSSIRSATRLK
jgi:hypothetical protein